MLVSHLYVFGEVSLQVPFPLFDWVGCFSGIELYKMLVYFGNCQLLPLLLFSPILRVVFHLVFYKHTFFFRVLEVYK